MACSIGRSYFITGATGALGREVLARVLRDDPRAEVVLLLRAAGAAEAAECLADLEQYLLAFFGPPAASWARVVTGDVTLPRLGLPHVEYARLAARVTHIVHCAASIPSSTPPAPFRYSPPGGRRARRPGRRS